MRDNSKRINIIIPILILVLTWPLLGGYFLVFARTWLWILIGCIAMVILSPSYYRKNNLLWMALYFIILIVNYYSGDRYYSSIPLICLEVGVLVFSSSILYYLNNGKRIRETKVIVWEVLIIISITSILSYLLNLSNPGVIRNSVTILNHEGDSSSLFFYYRLGMSNYELPHALPVIIPPLVLGIKNHALRLWERISLVVVLLLTIVLIIISDSATSVFLAFIMLLLSIISKIGSIRNNEYSIIIYLLLFLPLLLSDELKVEVLDFFAGLTSGEGSIHDRLIDIRQSIISDRSEGDIDARLELYTQSFGGFLESLFIGSNREMGGHSAILDRLSTLGVVGILPYIIFIWRQIKSSLTIIPVNYRLFYIEGLFAAFIMLLTKNMSNWEMWLMVFVMLPLLIICFGQNKNKQNIVAK